MRKHKPSPFFEWIGANPFTRPDAFPFLEVNGKGKSTEESNEPVRRREAVLIPVAAPALRRRG